MPSNDLARLRQNFKESWRELQEIKKAEARGAKRKLKTEIPAKYLHE
jgi:hypothetical protein